MAGLHHLRPARAPATLFAALMLAGCEPDGGSAGGVAAADPVVARVAGQAVYASEVKREAIAEGSIAEGAAFDPGSELFRRTLDEVVDETLLAREARRLRIDHDPLVRRRLAASADKVVGDALVEAVVDKAVTDRAVAALYAEQSALAPAADEMRAHQIVLATPAEAEQVRGLLAAGAAVEPLAQARSLDAATRFSGGDLGWFALDAMPGPFSAALKDARPGAVVGPIKVASGWAVVKVEGRRPERPVSLAEARPQIVRFLTYDEIRTLLARLRSTHKVEVLVASPPPAGPEPASAPAVAAPARIAPSSAEN